MPTQSKGRLSLNNHIAKLLSVRKRSQGWLSRVTGLDPFHLNKLVRGRIKDPRISTISKIAKALGVPVEEIWKV